MAIISEMIPLRINVEQKNTTIIKKFKKTPLFLLSVFELSESSTCQGTTYSTLAYLFDSFERPKVETNIVHSQLVNKSVSKCL